MTMGWQIYVLLLVIFGIVSNWVLLRWTSRYEITHQPGEEETTGHAWDGDLTEYNNPLPRWWLRLFQITIIFAIGYLILYPGSGVYEGVLGWSQEQQYAQEKAAAEQKYAPIFAAYAEQTPQQLMANSDAMSAGFNLFGNNCAQCHGSGGRGAIGFPNLTDNNWQWGGDHEQILSTIMNGRNGVMPGWTVPLGGDEGVINVANYVRSLSSLSHDEQAAAAGQQQFGMFCAACHGAEGKGNPLLGAPNLTDEIWLYRSTLDSIKYTIANGRNNQMPAYVDKLGANKVKLLAAYVQSLSADVQTNQAAATQAAATSNLQAAAQQ